MRNVHTDILISNLKEMCIEANLELTNDVSSRIIYAAEKEESELGKKIPLGRAALPEDICIPLLRQSILHHWRHPAGGWRTYTARHA